MSEYLEANEVCIIIHAAAFTSPPLVDNNPIKALDVNIIGSANIVKLCIKYDIYLIYISTDYVFRGDEGNYQEDDAVFPVNKYAWSKLGGECAVKLYENSLIIRTSFGSNTFPYQKAFVDQWTSRESVSVIALKISRLIDKNLKGILHVGGERKTVYEYAKSLDKSKDIQELSRNEVSFVVPNDTSLDCTKYMRSVSMK
jgi:dTDP-4-dehydrorhamnose reductase